MPNPYLALLIYLALGLYVIRFARRAYFHPDATLRRSYFNLLEKDWARRLLRGFSAFWVFGGFLIVQEGVIGLPFLSRVKGISLIAIIVLIASAGTALLLRRPT